MNLAMENRFGSVGRKDEGRRCRLSVSLSLSLSLYVEQNRSMVTVNRSSAVEMLRVLLSRAADLCKEMQSAAAADLLCWGAEELQLILAKKKKKNSVNRRRLQDTVSKYRQRQKILVSQSQ